MRQKVLFTKTTKNISSDEISKNAQLLTKAGFIRKEISGVYNFLPLGWIVLNKIENIIREEMNKIGGQEIQMPALTPESSYAQTGRQNLDILFSTQLSEGKKLFLNQSHEEVVVPLCKEFIKSYKDLPLYVYQIQTKFRNEPRAKSGILRGREFRMKDFYSFHTGLQDFEEFYEKVKQAYFNVFRRAGLDAKIVEASGGSFSKFSHEYQVFTDAGEDLVYFCDCGFAQNKEIVEVKEGDLCPKCKKNKVQVKKAIEVGNIFPLKTKFTDAFDVKFADKQGVNQPVIMGCYGIGSGRCMGTVVEVASDEAGMVWPISISPYQVHLLTIGKDEKIIENSDSIYKNLQDNGVSVLYDDRDESAGVKFSDSDLIGIPIRVVLSQKLLEQNKIEIKLRTKKEPQVIESSQFIDHLKNLILELMKNYN